MGKWGNYLIIGAVINMIIPFILDYFELLNNHFFWPVFSVILIIIGVLFHIINGIKNRSTNAQTLLLLSSVLIIVLGFSMVQLNIDFAEYILLAGMILVFIWLFTPNRKTQ